MIYQMPSTKRGGGVWGRGGNATPHNLGEGSGAGPQKPARRKINPLPSRLLNELLCLTKNQEGRSMHQARGDLRSEASQSGLSIPDLFMLGGVVKKKGGGGVEWGGGGGGKKGMGGGVYPN